MPPAGAGKSGEDGEGGAAPSRGLRMNLGGVTEPHTSGYRLNTSSWVLSGSRLMEHCNYKTPRGIGLKKAFYNIVNMEKVLFSFVYNYILYCCVLGRVAN